MLDFSLSIMEQKRLFGRTLWLKRDDLIHPICNGNKARKFAYLYESNPDFAEVTQQCGDSHLNLAPQSVDSCLCFTSQVDSLNLESIKVPHKTWISYGGNQSNAMFALAYLANLKGVAFEYVMPMLPPHLESLGEGADSLLMQNMQDFIHLLSMSADTTREEIDKDLLVRLDFIRDSINAQNLSHKGNLYYAFKYGMSAFALPVGSNRASLESYAKKLVDKNSLFIPQGGSVEDAMSGMNALAGELAQSIGGAPVICCSSGSGVGVIALRKALDRFLPKATLVALNIAGSEAELRAKCKTHNVAHIQILQSPFTFAKPHKEIWAMRAYLLENGVRADLVYDSPAFCLLQRHLESFKHKEIVFILSGGLLGDITQLDRYARILKTRLVSKH